MLEEINKSLEKRLIETLRAKGISNEKIDDVIDSGYYIRDFANPFSGETWESISDKMFGSKGQSSNIDISYFVEYIHGNYCFPQLPKFVEYTVKSFSEINEILSDDRRQHSISDGAISFRGQTTQYKYERKIPNPLRADREGKEISIFPGIYRQNNEFYSFKETPQETRTLQHLLHFLEPNNPNIYTDSYNARDILTVEQHYATQTAGLDISFDIETAIFFATYKFKLNGRQLAYYEKIKKGNHKGVIYGFRFRDPPVKKTEFLIKEFDLFKTYKPERIVRQECGLPLFGDYDRNIAITDLDFIIHLHEDFEYDGVKTPEYMFPNTKEDKFYAKLLELKDEHPDSLENIVEYEGSRV